MNKLTGVRIPHAKTSKVRSLMAINNREKFIARPGELSLSTQTAIYVWALMSNHTHLFLRSGQQ